MKTKRSGVSAVIGENSKDLNVAKTKRSEIYAVMCGNLKDLNLTKISMKTISVMLSGVLLVACNGGGGSGGSSLPRGITNPVSLPVGPGYMTVAISPPGVCSSNTVNIPCVSVTICNTANKCDTVPDIILDTGSFGLRVFNKFVSNLNLPNVMSSGSQVAECVYYGDNTNNWGPVVTANVQLATGITANNVPMQIIDNNYPGSSSTPCVNPSLTPREFKGNGILGVGPIVYDGGQYFACTGGACTAISNPPNNIQVANPIAMLSNPEYNNGLTLKFPGISDSGATGAIGYAIFGIGTNSDNSVGPDVNVYPSNSFLTSGGLIPIGMPVQYSNNSLIKHGFLDTGSNFYYFKDSTITQCPTSNPNFFTYCQSNPVTVNPSNQSENEVYIATTANIANANNLQSSGNVAFSNYGANLGTRYFDYGLPFFFNKTVYVGFSNESSSIGNGPYWAF